MDYGQEFCLCVFAQELFKEYKFDKRRTLWRQNPGEYSGFQVTGRCEGDPLDQNDGRTGVSGMVHGRKNDESRIVYVKFNFPK